MKTNGGKNYFPLSELVGLKKDLLPHAIAYAEKAGHDNGEKYLASSPKWNLFYNKIKDTDTIVTFLYEYPFASRGGYYVIREGEIVFEFITMMS